MRKYFTSWIAVAAAAAFAQFAVAQVNRPLLLAHYMPWYQSKAFSGSWGWHWTMNHFDPDRVASGRQEAASQFRPLIGLYDSADPDAVECEVLLMKLAGLDGMLIDWYGIVEAQDYEQNKRNADLAARLAARAGLKFAIVFEDNTLNELIRLKKIEPTQALATGTATLKWLDVNYFGLKSYVHLEGKPLLLDFGPQYFKSDSDWKSMFSELKQPPSFFSLVPKLPSATGCFAWPVPQAGEAGSLDNLKGFYRRASQWPAVIGVAYPRFADIYKAAGVGPGYGSISDRDGETFKETFSLALGSKAPVIQLATWNDWGEGTQIEPSQEFGYRDLEWTQRTRRSLDPAFKFTADDLRLPVTLYNMRQKFRNDKSEQSRLDSATKALEKGDTVQARLFLGS